MIHQPNKNKSHCPTQVPVCTTDANRLYHASNKPDKPSNGTKFNPATIRQKPERQKRNAMVIVATANSVGTNGQFAARDYAFERLNQLLKSPALTEIKNQHSHV